MAYSPRKNAVEPAQRAMMRAKFSEPLRIVQGRINLTYFSVLLQEKIHVSPHESWKGERSQRRKMKNENCSAKIPTTSQTLHLRRRRWRSVVGLSARLQNT